MALSRKKKIIIGAVSGVLLAVIIIVSVFFNRKETPEVTVVKLETRRELRSTVTASGEVRPIQFMNLTSEVQGRIEEIYVKEGDQVTKGQPLVRLDPEQLQSSADAQIAAVQAAQSDAEGSRTQIMAAQNQLSQAQQVLVGSQAAVDTARQQVVSAQQQVQVAQADIDKAEVDLFTARRELKRSAELLEAGAESRSNYDAASDRVKTAEVALRNSQARLKAQQLAVTEANLRVKESQSRVAQQEVAIRDARRGVESAGITANSSAERANQAQALLRGQKSQRDKTLTVAPINGVIAEIPSKVGTFAVAGLSTTALLTIADMSSINVEVKVDETEIDKVEVGQPAKIKVDAFGDNEIIGKVRQKTPLAVGKSQTTGGLSTNINVQEAKEFRVVIELENIPDSVRDSLRPGMSATAVITTKTVENVVTVPLQAIVEKQPDVAPAPTVQGDVPTPADKPKPIKGVYIMDGNKAKFIEVTTGITGESDIQITNGLENGQQVVTGPSRILKTLKDGDVIKQQTNRGGANANKS